jgi:glucose-1-phosphate adenylyltransferase
MAQGVPRYWRDIGTIDAYYAASMDTVHAESPLKRKVPVRQSPRIDVKAQVGRSVLSLGVEVERNAVVYDSVLMPGVRVGTGAQLRGVIVEEGVHIPAGFCAGFDVVHDRKHQFVNEKGVAVIAHEPGNVRSRRGSELEAIRCP